MFCLTGKAIEAFKERFKSGEITPEKLAEMDSAQRHGYFASFLGEGTAQKVNELFEKQLLLKNQKAGIIEWAQSVSGMKPAQVRDIVSRVNRMENVLKPESEEAFLADLASHKVGATVTAEEAANIYDLAKNIADKKEAMGKGGEAIEYGRAKVAFDNYINDLKTEAKAKPLSEYIKPQNYIEGAAKIGGLQKALQASLDISALLRQGLRTLFNHPEVWAKNSLQSFKDVADTFQGKEVLDEVRAEILSRPNAISGLYKREGLAVGVREEAYPESLPEKIPVLGKAFKASEAAFQAWFMRTRADVFDKLHEQITENGGDPKGLGTFVNSLTGRGHLGRLEPSANIINPLFFSIRKAKSDLDTLLFHSLDYNRFSPEVRKIAALSALKSIVGIATTMAVIKAFNKDAIEFDSRSSDFGKARFGDTRFDLTGGVSPFFVLASRLATHESKSSVTDIISKIDSNKFGAQTSGEILADFTANKLSPLITTLYELQKGKDREGNSLTPGKFAQDHFTPLMFQNFNELKNNPNSANIVAGMIADGLGISTNTYSYKMNWSASEGKELKQFHETIGDKDFQEANKEFNTRFNERLKVITRSKEYQGLSEDDKRSLLQNERSDIKKDIFLEYNFHYRKDHKEKLPKIEE